MEEDILKYLPTVMFRGTPFNSRCLQTMVYLQFKKVGNARITTVWNKNMEDIIVFEYKVLNFDDFL